MVTRVWGVLLLTVGLLALGVAVVVAGRKEPLPVPLPLTAAAFGLLVVGQVTAIASGYAGRRAEAEAPEAGPVAGLFPNRLAIVVWLAFLSAWLLALTAFGPLRSGVPEVGQPRCRYAQVNHGTVTCVDEEVYVEARAAQQRLVAAVLAGFLVGQGGGFLGAEMRTPPFRRRR